MKPPFVSLLIICLIAFVFVSAASVGQSIEVKRNWVVRHGLTAP
jgi:hypothetical protein